MTNRIVVLFLVLVLFTSVASAQGSATRGGLLTGAIPSIQDLLNNEMQQDFIGKSGILMSTFFGLEDTLDVDQVVNPIHDLNNPVSDIFMDSIRMDLLKTPKFDDQNVDGFYIVMSMLSMVMTF